MRLGTSKDDIFDLSGIEVGRLTQDIFDAVRGKVIRARHVEGAAERFRKASPRAGHYDSLSHIRYALRLPRSQDGKQRDPQQAEEVPVVGGHVDQFAAFRFSKQDHEQRD